MSTDPHALSRRQRLVALTRHRGRDDAEVIELRREVAADTVAARIRKIVDAAPPLTDEQRSKLVRLLAPAAPAQPLDAA